MARQWRTWPVQQPAHLVAGLLKEGLACMLPCSGLVDLHVCIRSPARGAAPRQRS